MLGHITINSVRNVFVPLKETIKDKIDNILISQTKLDIRFPVSQFRIDS